MAAVCEIRDVLTSYSHTHWDRHRHTHTRHCAASAAAKEEWDWDFEARWGSMVANVCIQFYNCDFYIDTTWTFKLAIRADPSRAESVHTWTHWWDGQCARWEMRIFAPFLFIVFIGGGCGFCSMLKIVLSNSINFIFHWVALKISWLSIYCANDLCRKYANANHGRKLKWPVILLFKHKREIHKNNQN